MTRSSLLPLSDVTISAVQAEALAAHIKHGPNSLLSPGAHWSSKLAALVEEVGEVATELTYDHAGDRAQLVRELLQVASVALSWVESIEGTPFGGSRDGTTGQVPS